MAEWWSKSIRRLIVSPASALYSLRVVRNSLTTHPLNFKSTDHLLVLHQYLNMWYFVIVNSTKTAFSYENRIVLVMMESSESKEAHKVFNVNNQRQSRLNNQCFSRWSMYGTRVIELKWNAKTNCLCCCVWKSVTKNLRVLSFRFNNWNLAKRFITSVVDNAVNVKTPITALTFELIK